MEAWAQQPPILGQQAGIFKKLGIVLENFGTQGAGETLQTVISGAADIGIGIGTAGVMRAFSKGAPVRIFGASQAGHAIRHDIGYRCHHGRRGEAEVPRCTADQGATERVDSDSAGRFVRHGRQVDWQCSLQVSW
jgi:hypothetical protein